MSYLQNTSFRTTLVFRSLVLLADGLIELPSGGGFIKFENPHNYEDARERKVSRADVLMLDDATSSTADSASEGELEADAMRLDELVGASLALAPSEPEPVDPSSKKKRKGKKKKKVETGMCCIVSMHCCLKRRSDLDPVGLRSFPSLPRPSGPNLPRYAATCRTSACEAFGRYRA